MTYEEALEYIHGISWTFCKPGLDRTRELCERMGNPQKGLNFIHVAGTNGKGSFCSMLSSVLKESGLRVGLYTSPYIVRFNERMQVNGEPITDEMLAAICDEIRPYAEGMTDKPTEFELITVIAFEYFKRMRVDVVVLECGMGGRLDSTNIIDSPYLSVITGISLDHTAFLGSTVEEIAREKAGIIKPGTPVLYGGNSKSAADVIAERAKTLGSEFTAMDYDNLCLHSANLDGAELSYKSHTGIRIKLLGLYQARNCALVLEATDILQKRGLGISGNAIRRGLENARWPARFEIIADDPLTIFDGAHNPEGIESATGSISYYFGDKKVYVITGVLKDKDYRTIAGYLARVADRAFVITPDNPRALPAEEYCEVLSSFGIKATPCVGISEAVREATQEAKEDSRALCCLGSLYTYGEIIKSINKIKGE